MNGVYIRQLSAADLAVAMTPFLERDLPAELQPIDHEYLLRIVPLVQERLKLLADSAQATSYFFADSLGYDSANLVQKGMDGAGTQNALKLAGDALQLVDSFGPAELEQTLRAVGEELGLRPREFFGALREAVTARSATPSLFEVMAVLGQDRVLTRLATAQDYLSRT